MSTETPQKRTQFPKVSEAREALKSKALAMVELYEKAILHAIAAEDYQAALKAIQWWVEHAPSQDGVTIIDAGVDVKAQEKGQKGPSIQIGIKLGGPHQKQMVAAQNDVEVIDITPTKLEDTNESQS